jgi:predicted nucleic acid-binding Zn ribbon protein
MRENRASERLDSEGLFEKWKEVVGEEVAERTRVVDIRRGELVVEVDSAPLLNELSTYYREEILRSLQEREEYRGIQSIRFKPGAF